MTPPLSQAIRLGAMIRRQGRRLYFHHDTSCTIGAALEAAGVPYGARVTPERVWDLFPLLGPGSYATHPITGVRGAVFDIITDLNDNYLWTREQIADWGEAQVETPVERISCEEVLYSSIKENES